MTKHNTEADIRFWTAFTEAVWKWPGWNRTRRRTLHDSGLMPNALPGGSQTTEPERRSGDTTWNDLMGYDPASVRAFLTGGNPDGHGGYAWHVEELRAPRREDGTRGPRALVFSDDALQAARERVGVERDEFARVVGRRSRKARTPGEQAAYNDVRAKFRAAVHPDDRGVMKLLSEAYGTSRTQLRRLMR